MHLAEETFSFHERERERETFNSKSKNYRKQYTSRTMEKNIRDS